MGWDVRSIPPSAIESTLHRKHKIQHKRETSPLWLRQFHWKWPAFVPTFSLLLSLYFYFKNNLFIRRPFSLTGHSMLFCIISFLSIWMNHILISELLGLCYCLHFAWLIHFIARVIAFLFTYVLIILWTLSEILIRLWGLEYANCLLLKRVRTSK